MSPRDNDTIVGNDQASASWVIRIIVAANILGLLAVAIVLYRHLTTMGGAL